MSRLKTNEYDQNMSQSQITVQRVKPFRIDFLTEKKTHKWKQEYKYSQKIKINDWLRTRVRKKPIIALYSMFENELKFYNLGPADIIAKLENTPITV